MAKIILGLTGEIASGKGAIVKYLKDKHQASSYRFSDSLRDVLKRLYLKVSRKNLDTLSTNLREKFGQDLLANIVYNDVQKDKNDLIIVDGVRREPDIEKLQKLPEFKLLFIDVDPKVRYERMKKRQENVGDENKTYEEFLKDLDAEPQRQIRSLKEKADYVLDNSKDFEYLYEQVEEVIKK